MTRRANSLTGRAMIPGRTLAVFLEGLAVLGYDADELASAAGLSRGELRHPDALIPCDAYEVVIGTAQRRRFTPNLGIELAQRTPLGAWPLIDYLVATADSVGAGVRQLARYLRLSGDPISIVVREGVNSIDVEFQGFAPFACEFEAALITLRLRDETAQRFHPSRVSLRHRPDDPVAFERTLRCALEVGTAWDGLTIARDTWQLPLRRRDPILRALLERQADDMLARVPDGSGVTLKVRRALAGRVGGGDTKMASVARELAMSSRTLQRRLAEERTAYQTLLDEARKAMAGRYLSEGSLTIGEVAYLLGYSEPAAFHRAFRRWYGRTPDRFRTAAGRQAASAAAGDDG